MVLQVRTWASRAVKSVRQAPGRWQRRLIALLISFVDAVCPGLASRERRRGAVLMRGVARGVAANGLQLTGVTWE
jgi:hypothetical protein